MTEKDNVQVRVRLDGELLQKANTLKKYYGIECYSELVRILLNDQYRNIEAPKYDA
ncbi:MAG: hypothetical protein N3D85_07815 [Candidatus Bathyarchaeota archaeon]|nr:hypothetical protein [Candidatus Bathyarchaeota archaeon]